MQVVRREVRGEGVGQALLRRQLGAVQAGAEQPERHLGADAGHGDHPLAGLCRAEQVFQFLDVLREIIVAARALAAQRAGGVLVGTRCAAQPQVDASRIEGGEGAELFGDHQRCMVGQHDATGADPDARSASRQVADQHGGGGAGDAVHVVVLGHPEAGEAQRLHMPGQGQGIVQGLGRPAIVADGAQVEHGKIDVGQSGHCVLQYSLHSLGCHERPRESAADRLPG
ncbi:hypothetical protein D3C78_1211550 [compost metagenome]